MNIWSFFNQSLRARCLLCGAHALPGHALCIGCFDDLPTLHSACPRCARALPAASRGEACGVCQSDPPPYDRTVALCHYAAPLEQLLQAFKFSGRLAIAPTLAHMLAARVADLPPLPEVIVPVPLHPTRLRARGYNQAVELAKPLARHLGLQWNIDALRRTRATTPQTDLDADARRRNLRHAFTVDAHFRAKHVAIVDDVMTTGSTVSAIALELRKNGVEQIDVWVVARTQ